MTAVAVYKLAEKILDLHEHHLDPNGLTIVPVILVAPNAGAGDVEAFQLALGDAEGLLIEASDNAGGARGDLRDDLAQLIDVTLSERGRGDLLVSKAGDGVVVTTTDGVTAANASEAQRELFGVLATLFDQRLSGSNLAALVYDESEFDDDTADMVWSLCAKHLANIEWANLRTLVVIARAGRVVPERHYHPNFSARFVVNGDSLHIRRSWETDNTDLQRIARSDARIVLFLAAGFSMSSKTDDGQPLPMGNELRDRALRRLMHSVASSDELARRYLRYCKERNSLLPGERRLTEEVFARGLTLERVLVDELKDPPEDLGPTLQEFKAEVEQAHVHLGAAIRALREFLEATKRRVVLVTVNLDDLIEQHCSDHISVVLSDDDFADAADMVREYWQTGGQSPLLKLHGSLEQPETLVATVNSVQLGLSDAKIAALDAALLGPLGERTTVCYVGASMRDRDLNQLLGLRRYADRLDEWWIAPTIAASVREFVETYRHRRWQVSGVPNETEARSITVTADAFVLGLATEAQLLSDTELN